MFYQAKTDILSPQQCMDLITRASSLGFEAAKVQMYGEQKSLEKVRNNSRVEFSDTNLARELTTSLQTAFGEDFPYTFNERTFAKVSEHFRVYRYQPGEYFKPHKDGGYTEEPLSTLVTVLFYLNTTEGGETIVMPQGFKEKSSWITINPAEGSVLMFQHNVFHEGRPVLEGYKYVLRTDLFFNP